MSNGLAEGNVRCAKILLRKALQEKQNYCELLCHFNQSPRADGYSPSELFHGRRVRNALPTIDTEIDIEKGKAARENVDLITKSIHQVNNPLAPLEVGALCYRYEMDGKHQALINNPCEVLSVRSNGQSYYIRDLETDRIYLRNRKYIRPSESSKNLEHMTRNIEVVFDTNLQYKLDNCKQEEAAWNLSTTTTPPSASCFQGRNRDKMKRVHFDGTLFACRVELRKFRSS